MIDTQILLILREVYRGGGVTPAAENLCLTQSAVSHAVRRFESRHGVRLWEKEGRGIRLTQAGSYLLMLAERILPQLDHAERVIEDFSRGRRGALRVGMECHPCQQWLMQVVDPFLRQWPDVDLDVTTAFSFGGLAALLGHEIDMLITPDPVARPKLTYEAVFDYELVLVVPPGHELEQKTILAPQDLTGETLITYPVERERLDIFTQFLGPAGCLPRRHRTAETSEMMLRLVRAGRGVSAIPNWLLHEMADAKGLHSLKIGEPGIDKSIYIGVREEDRPTDFIEGFLAIAAAQPFTVPANTDLAGQVS